MTSTYSTNAIPNGGNITLSTGAGSVTLNTGAGVGGAGQIYTTVANGTSWAVNNPNDNVMIVSNNPPELEVKGRFVLNGLDLEERLGTIEKVLTIPERDVKLEAKHPKLKKLYDEYISALGKYRTFEAIKGDDNGTA